MEVLVDKLESYDNILWDWNGTLLNDVEICYEIVRTQMKSHNIAPLSVEELKDYFCFPIQKYYEDIGFPVCRESFVALASSFHESYQAKVKKEAQIFTGTREMLAHLQHKNQFIVSASEERYLQELVASYNLDSYFKKISGLSDRYGASKSERCKKLMKENSIDPTRTILVGDTSHDAEVADEAGIDVVLVADGFHKYEKLKGFSEEVLRSRY